ncbi:MAG TPA: crotonase/enoyl-CoA hydratase family protein [Iamia sp.]|nr:crotonase/enoyl-CoA hydratase family protein [Iamia sp.]
MSDTPSPPAGVTVIRIGRPERRNAIDSVTAQRLHDELIAFDEDPDLRVAVLTGDERAFCAGADLVDLPRLRPSGPLGPTRLQLSKPVVAAVEGWCVAGGIELAAWCDLRVAGESAVFGCLERRWGVPLIDGGTYRLPQIVGLGRALDWILTGREIPAAEAERAGFVTRLVPDGTALAAAVELAAGIADKPWTCVTHDRTSVYEGLGLGLEEALANEDRHGQAVIFADGFAEGVARFTANQRARSDAGER